MIFCIYPWLDNMHINNLHLNSCSFNEKTKIFLLSAYEKRKYQSFFIKNYDLRELEGIKYLRYDSVYVDYPFTSQL